MALLQRREQWTAQHRQRTEELEKELQELDGRQTADAIFSEVVSELVSFAGSSPREVLQGQLVSWLLKLCNLKLH